MLRIIQTTDKFEIITIPAPMIVMTVGFIILQIGVFLFLLNSLQTVSFNDFFGYDWLNCAMNIFIYLLPICFVIFAILIMPIGKIELNLQTKIVSITKFNLFYKPQKFGFEFIKTVNHAVLDKTPTMPLGTLYFELKSGERVIFVEANTSTAEKASEILKKINKILKF